MTGRRRHPDDWAHIRRGDIVSFASSSPRVGVSAYVRDVSVRADGRHVISRSPDPDIVEAKSLNMRLNERALTLAMMEDGGPLPHRPGVMEDLLAGWRVRMTFDWFGKQPPVFTIEADRPFLLYRVYWNVRRTEDLRDDTDLILEAWGEMPATPPVGQLFSEPRAWRRFNPDTRQVDAFPTQEVVYSDIRPRTPQNEAAFAESDIRPDVVKTLDGILGWIYDRRYELDDPGQQTRKATEDLAG